MKEIWKDILGYEGLYQISNYGNLKRSRRVKIFKDDLIRIIPEKILRGGIGGTTVKYNTILLTKNKKVKSYFVHRLVLMHFDRIPNKGEEGNHIDFNSFNNRIDNLEWVTHSQNCIHSREKYRLSKQGEKHPAAKITDLQAIEIKRLRKQKVKHKVIGEMFNITVQNSINIATRCYSHIDHLV